MADVHSSNLAKAIEAVRVAEQRRNEQALIVSELVNPEARAWAERILRERDRTLQLACMYCAILELAPPPSDDGAIRATSEPLMSDQDGPGKIWKRSRGDDRTG